MIKGDKTGYVFSLKHGKGKKERYHEVRVVKNDVGHDAYRLEVHKGEKVVSFVVPKEKECKVHKQILAVFKKYGVKTKRIKNKK